MDRYLGAARPDLSGIRQDLDEARLGARGAGLFELLPAPPADLASRQAF
jgi:hypothetical protein